MRKTLLIAFLLFFYVLAQAQDKKLRVAILDPTTSGISVDEGTRLAVRELISSAFVNTGRFIIIERSMIDQILKEQSFQNSDLVDNAQASEIGKLAGANKVVLSAVSLVGGRNMLSIKIVDVTTASVEKHKTKIVSSSDLLDAVEPLTLELLGEEAVYVKQNTYFASTPANNNQSQVTPEASQKVKDVPNNQQSTSFNYSKEYKEICQQISEGIDALKSVNNPQLEKLIADNKIETYFSLERGLKAEINAAGILVISGNGEMMPSDEKLLSKYKPYARVIIIEEGVTKIGDFNSFNKVQYVKLSNTVQIIDENCFYSCSSLKAINIPSKVSKIGKNAFKQCGYLESLSLPNSVEFLGEGAFKGCQALTKINIPNVSIIPEGLFANCRALEEIVIPTSVKNIGKDAFNNCRSVESLYIPDNVVFVGEAAFQHMHNLREIRMSENIPSIPNQAFDDCRSLFSVTCPESVKSVGKEAFTDCKQLAQITFLSKSMISFGEECFDDCDHLVSIELHSINPPACRRIFGNDKDMYERVTLSIPEKSRVRYKDADCWEDFEIIVTF